jgi:hypothetical protein
MHAIKRDFFDRRSGKDRRRKFKLGYFLYKGSEKRSLEERRLQAERRGGWVKISKWSSVCLADIKLAKFLR